MKRRRLCLAVTLALASVSTFGGNVANPETLDLAPIPAPCEFACNADRTVGFAAGAKVVVSCPDANAVTWLNDRFREWYGDRAPRASSGPVEETVPDGDEAHVVVADEKGVRIAARSLSGVRWAAYSLRQLAVARRGTFTLEGMELPELRISDRPRLAFRAMHLCWFADTRPEQIERAIRLAAALKFNYAILEFFGTFRYERNRWFGWPEAAADKARVARLVGIGRDLGITLIPQFNAFGHGGTSKTAEQRHASLDLDPTHEPLFEPGGWNWCLTNPETQRVMREIISELHEAFGNPPYFHIGCDEVQLPCCRTCRATDYGETARRHIAALNEFIKGRCARTMMWHDMLLQWDDPRWRRKFAANGFGFSAGWVDTLPKDIVICDWEYAQEKEPRAEWPTIDYFESKGFSVACCPWENYRDMKSLADRIARSAGFGYIQTTWDHLTGANWADMYRNGSAAAWGTVNPPPRAFCDPVFARTLRAVGYDMHVRERADTGIIGK